MSVDWRNQICCSPSGDILSPPSLNGGVDVLSLPSHREALLVLCLLWNCVFQKGVAFISLAREEFTPQSAH